MKKLVLSLCALCLVGVAGAQVLNSPLREKASKLEQQSDVSPFKAYGREVQGKESSPKAGAVLDSVLVEAAYTSWDGSNQMLRYMGSVNLNEKGYCNEDKIKWVYGTGAFITWAGTGEIGYRFWAGEGSTYATNGMYPRLGVPYAASALIERAPSTSRLREDGTYDSMPFYFKLYNSSKVGEQKVIMDLSEYGPTRGKGLVDVVYPTDPTKYTALSDTVMIPAGCLYDSVGKGWADGTDVKAEFRNVDASQRLGDNFCVSMMFPVDWDEEGDTITASASTWNAFPYMMFNQNGLEAMSEESHSVYYVYDFERTTGMFNDGSEDRPKNRLDVVEKGIVKESLVAEEYMQPNIRYAVIPFDSWYWEKTDNGPNTVAEPLLKIYYTEWVALQSANKADRYVQVTPVPAVDYVNFTSYADMSRIEIYSLGGQLVKAVNVSGDTYRMDLAGLNSGMYVARIYSEKGISSKKLVVR